MVDHEFLTVAEFARALRMNREVVRRWLRTGVIAGTRLPGDKLGWRIPRSEVERMLPYPVRPGPNARAS